MARLLAPIALLACGGLVACITGLDGFSGGPASTTDDAGLDAGSKPDAAAAEASTSCGALQTDAHNCGTCGHDCLGGTCTAGVCDAVVLVQGISSAHIRLDDTYVYLADSFANRIVRVPKKGGTVETLAENQAGLYEFTLDPDTLYFHTSDAVRSIPKGGGAVTSIVPATNVGAITTDPAAIFWAEGDVSAGSSTIQRQTRDGTQNDELARDLSGVESLAIDGNNLFYGEDGVDGTGGGIGVIHVADGQNDVVAATRCRRLALDATDIYFVNYVDPAVYKVPKTGGNAATIATSALPIKSGDLALDDASVYWAVNEDAGGVYQVAKTGGPITTIADNQKSPSGVAVDAAAIYWTVPGDNKVWLRAR